MSLNNGIDKDTTDTFGRPFNDWLNRVFRKKPAEIKPTDKPAAKPQHDAALLFAEEFKRDPEGTYKKYSARDISNLLAQAKAKGFLTDKEVPQHFDKQDQEKKAASSITPELEKSDGGYRNALSNQWKSGNMIEPDKSKYTTETGAIDMKKYLADKAEWEALVQKSKGSVKSSVLPQAGYPPK